MLVMTFGTFDRFHPGHEYYLREAHKKGERLITVVARDATVERIKGKCPRDNEHVRLQNVISSGLSEQAILGSLSDPYEIILLYKPDILCFGYDQRSFNGKLLEQFLADNHLAPTMITLDPFEPDTWKSSLLA